MVNLFSPEGEFLSVAPANNLGKVIPSGNVLALMERMVSPFFKTRHFCRKTGTDLPDLCRKERDAEQVDNRKQNDGEKEIEERAGANDREAFPDGLNGEGTGEVLLLNRFLRILSDQLTYPPEETQRSGIASPQSFFRPTLARTPKRK